MSKLQTNFVSRHWSGKDIFRRTRKWRAKRKMRGKRTMRQMEIHKGQKRWLFASVSLSITPPWFTCIIWGPSRRLFNHQRCSGGAAKQDGQWAAIFKGVQEAVEPKCCRTSRITLRVFRRVARVQVFNQRKIGNWKIDVWYTDVEHRVMANAASTTNPTCI